MLKNLIKKFVVISIPVGLLVILVNYFGDAASLFENGYEKQVAGIIASGQFVTNVSNFDDRIFQRELITSGRISPQTAVFGSSRAMNISAGIYGDSLLFNSSVFFACIEDIVAIYQIYKSSGKLPKKIIIGIDPWLFSENSAHTTWKSIASYYEAFTSSNSSDLIDYKYRQLFSLSYFQSSLKNIPARIKGSTRPLATREKYNKQKTRLTDGSIVYGASVRNISTTEVEKQIKAALSNDVSSSGKLYIISDRVWQLFDKVVTDMEKNNIAVEFFFAPFPKLVYERNANNLDEIENTVRKYAAAHQVKTWGSYNSIVLKMDNTYFMDDRHCNEKALKEIFH